MLVVVAIVAVAIVVRLLGLRWGLPYLYDFDEPNNLIRTLTMLTAGDPNPHWFHYGSLMFYVYGGVIAAGSWVLGLSGSGGGLALPEMIAPASGYMSDPWPLLAARYTAVILSVATVVVIYLIVRRLTARRWAAAYSATIFALAPVAVSEGRLFSPNTLSGLLAAIGVGASLRVYRRGLSRDYVVAGVIVGLAAGAKYNAGLVGICVLIAHWLRLREGSPAVRRGPLMAIYASLGAFIVTTPFAVLDSSEFLGDVGFELAHYTGGHIGSDGAAAFFLALLAALSFALLLLPFAVRDRMLRGPALIVLGYGLVYLIGFGLLKTSFVRNLLPVLPALCVASGLGLVSAWDSMGRKSNRWRGALVVVVLGTVAVSASSLAIQYRDLEDRSGARQWIATNLPGGSTVVVDPYTPWVDPSAYSVRPVEYMAIDRLPDDWGVLILTPRGSGRYEPSSIEGEEVEAVRTATCLLKEFPGVAEIRARSCS